MTARPHRRPARQWPQRLAAPLAACWLSLSVGAGASPKSPPVNRPNVLLIVADDLGYADLGAYGSEIATPNIDALAARGMRFTRFESHLLCTPSRVNLLTGVNNHVAGYGNMRGDAHPLQRGKPGYEEVLNQRVVTLAELLRESGYRTMVTGKWDLGPLYETGPDRRGFDRSWVLMQGAADHFQALPALEEVPTPFYRENGWPVSLPADHYSSTTFASKLIGYLRENEDSGKPFFGVLSFTAPHWPLQAPDAFLERYRDRYRSGYEPIRAARLARQKNLGLVPDTLRAAPAMTAVWPTWEQLSPVMRDLEARRMQVYAAMIEALDHEVGRVIEYLRTSGQLDNTFILFVSDNGAAADQTPNWGWYPWIERVFDLRPENMGRRGSYVWLGPGWAHVSATPWRLGKGFPTRGGTLVPAIVFDHRRVRPGSITHSRATMLDVVPTVLEMAGVRHPAPEWRGRRVEALEGRSLLPVLADPSRSIHDAGEVTVREIWNRRSVQAGDWKIVWMNRPWGRGFGAWSLFNLRADPTELNDVAALHPARVAELVGHWNDYVRRTGAIMIDDFDVPLDNYFTHYDWLPPTLRDTPPGSYATPPWVVAPMPAPK